MLVLPAELTHAEAPACSGMLAQALRSDAGAQAVADASALQRFDSSALAVLLECRREALALGKTFAVAHMPARLHDLASLYGVAELLPAA
jgi:phospholipid transport system transporter-binding protein